MLWKAAAFVFLVSATVVGAPHVYAETTQFRKVAVRTEAPRHPQHVEVAVLTKRAAPDRAPAPEERAAEREQKVVAEQESGSSLPGALIVGLGIAMISVVRRMSR